MVLEYDDLVVMELRVWVRDGRRFPMALNVHSSDDNLWNNVCSMRCSVYLNLRNDYDDWWNSYLNTNNGTMRMHLIDL